MTGEKMAVDIGELERVLKWLRTINNTPICNITWLKDGVKLETTIEELDHWRFVGLNNTYFAKMKWITPGIAE